MSTTTPHPYAHILRAIAEGKNIQWLGGDARWYDQAADTTLLEITSSEFSPARYRVHVENTIPINGHDVPKPLSEMPPKGTEVFWPSFGPNAGDDMTEQGEVGFYPTMLPDLLAKGLLHLTSEAASQHASALASFTTAKP